MLVGALLWKLWRVLKVGTPARRQFTERENESIWLKHSG
jgi:hypothetical protein